MLNSILDKGSTQRDISKAALEFRNMRYQMNGMVYDLLDCGKVKLKEHSIKTSSGIELQLLRAESSRNTINFPESVAVPSFDLMGITFLEYVDRTLASSQYYFISERNLSESDEINRLKEINGTLYKLSRHKK